MNVHEMAVILNSLDADGMGGYRVTCAQEYLITHDFTITEPQEDGTYPDGEVDFFGKG
jgi:hypothetical protein